MADIKVKCTSIRCEQISGYGMEVTLENVLESDMKEISIEEYNELLDNEDRSGIMLDETEMMLCESQKENEKLKQKVKNLRGKLNDKTN